MEERKRTILAMIISCIIVLAVGYSFCLSFFTNTDEIVVPDPSAPVDVSSEPEMTGEQGGVLVEVTPETVQSVIADMTRFRSYSRTVTVRYIWEGGAGELVSQVMVDNGWVRCDTVLPSGITEHSITGDETLWYWYDGGEHYLTKPAALQTEDLAQHIPTYEAVLDLDTREITGAGYEEKDGVPTVYVETGGGSAGTLTRYWVAVDSGLLLAAETEEDGAVVYSMSSADMVSPLTEAKGAFTLPDGTVLHEVQP